MTKIQVRRGTAAQWTASTTPLDEGEIGYETDTGKYKIGRKSGGTAIAWNSLGYAVSGGNSTLANALTVSGGLVFTSGSTFDGSAARNILLSSTIDSNTSGNAATATALATSRTINGAAFNGTSNVIVGGAVFGTSATSGASFRNIYVTQSTPSTTTNGDVWISW
jgi:hypothetical protein